MFQRLFAAFVVVGLTFSFVNIDSAEAGRRGIFKGKLRSAVCRVFQPRCRVRHCAPAPAPTCCGGVVYSTPSCCTPAPSGCEVVGNVVPTVPTVPTEPGTEVPAPPVEEAPAPPAEEAPAPPAVEEPAPVEPAEPAAPAAPAEPAEDAPPAVDAPPAPQ